MDQSTETYYMQLIIAIKTNVNVVDLISRYTELTLDGSEYSGPCPYQNCHGRIRVKDEKHSTASGMFRCDECRNAGDVFTFVEKMTKCGFLDACEKLAHEFAVNIDQPPPN